MCYLKSFSFSIITTTNTFYLKNLAYSRYPIIIIICNYCRHTYNNCFSISDTALFRNITSSLKMALGLRMMTKHWKSRPTSSSPLSDRHWQMLTVGHPPFFFLNTFTAFSFFLSFRGSNGCERGIWIPRPGFISKRVPDSRISTLGKSFARARHSPDGGLLLD